MRSREKPIDATSPPRRVHPLLRTLLVLATGLAGAYVILFAWGYTQANRLVFLPPSPSYGMGEPYRQLEMTSGELVTIRHIENPEATYTVLYSHGNGEDLGWVEPVLEEWISRGYSVVGYDYAGYGTSTGAPSERAIRANIVRVHEYLTAEKNIAPERILVYGWSLGGTPSVRLASEKPVGGLILDSTFTSAPRVWTGIPIFPPVRFDNLGRIDDVECPVLVVHGSADRMIPPWHGEQLYARANEPKLWLEVPGADHGDTMWAVADAFWVKLAELTALVER
jgi:hypothetical protein